MKLPKSSGQPKKPKFLLIRRVQGESMMPTLKSGRLILACPANHYKIDDVVVLAHDGLEKIKRINRIKSDKVYVLGDNSVASSDSRQFGWLSRDVLVAKVVWPRNKARGSKLRGGETVALQKPRTE